ncbi:MAG: hypothetical protein LBM75_09725 [Myxococcales bacterium]|jgi:hypothetical protein|nr:hypothetical protein [Myxococcales bacterium]
MDVEMEMDRDVATPVDHLKRMMTHTKVIQGESQALLHEAQGALRGVEALLVAQPWKVALASVGVGYVLGGGLFTRLTARLLRLGMRTVLLPAIESEVTRALSDSCSSRGAASHAERM